MQQTDANVSWRTLPRKLDCHGSIRSTGTRDKSGLLMYNKRVKP